MQTVKLYCRIVKPKGFEPFAVFMRTSAQRRYSEYTGIWLRGCYAHLGQHGECTDNFTRAKRASKAETRELVRELESIGYNVTLV